MAGKITTVLTKREAETYRSQGLHGEAISLYSDLLASSPNIDPAIRSAIQSQIQGIQEELQDNHKQKGRMLTSQEIARIREGWGERATETDILVCAQAFFQIGAYAEAIKEFAKLLARGKLKKIYITTAADCLLQLHPPQALPQGAEAFAKAVSQTPKTILAIILAMAQHMETRQHAEHALALYRHLQRVPVLAAAMQKRIDALNADTKPPAT